MEQVPLFSPTLRQIATAAKVSATTVSLALRNHARIRLATRVQIQALARQMGYRPNPQVTSLMTQVRSRHTSFRETLGWINSFDREDYFTNPNLPAPAHARMLWQGARERASELGYGLDSFWLGAPGMNGRRMSAILAARGIRGLLIPPLPQHCGHLSLDWREFAVIALCYTLARPEFHRVVADHYHNMQMVLRVLRHRGYHRVGLLIPARHDERLENRFRSAFYFQQQGIAVRDRVPVLICARENFREPCAAWLRKYRPDAVITLGDFQNLRQIDIGQPAYSQKLGVVIMGHPETQDGLAWVNEHPCRIAGLAIDRLARLLGANECGIPAHLETVHVKGTWMDGPSLPSIRPGLSALRLQSA
jgi:LacI family transcriptional regulator